MATLVKIHPDGREELKDGGAMCDAIRWNEDDTFKEVAGHKPIVGCSLMVGSIRARSYADQDYWLTTTVTKILEETEDYVIFETENSIYKLLI
jgi:hypothetical protein